MRTATLVERLAERFNLLPAAIHDTFPAVLFGRTLAIAVRIGVFESLHMDPQSSELLAAKLGLSTRGTELMLQSLEACGYLEKRGDMYRVTRRAKKWLVRSSPSYLGNFIEYIELLHTHWLTLEETLRDGHPQRTYFEKFEEKEWKVYTLGMMDLARLVIPKLSKHIKVPSTSKRLLDLGGSHGFYSIEMCRRHPTLVAEVVDVPQVLRTTREILAEHRMEQRITLVPGNLTSIQLEQEKYDVVFAFNILHGFDAETNQRLIRAVAKSLTPQGVVYILDQFVNSASKGIERLLPLMVGLNLINEVGGDVYTCAEIQGMCKKAGLHEVKQHTVGLPGVKLLSARRQKISGDQLPI